MSYTAEQQQALAEAYLILEQAFDHVLVAVGSREQPGALVQEDYQVCWAGGWVATKDMAEVAVGRIGYRKRITRCPPVISDEVMKGLNGRSPRSGSS